MAALKKPRTRASRGRRRPGSRAMTPDALTLFRFSALTFNSHRIHYDALYAAAVEKLPGLVVQGKLIALQLLETVRRAAPQANPQAVRVPFHATALRGRALHACREAGRGRHRRAIVGANDAGAVVQTASLTLANPING